MTRKLTLKKESLTELSEAELGSVAGGELSGECLPDQTMPLAYCLTLAGSRCIY